MAPKLVHLQVVPIRWNVHIAEWGTTEGAEAVFLTLGILDQEDFIKISNEVSFEPL